jgi:hypothetical protein
VLLLAPWRALYDVVGLAAPDPAWPFMAAGAGLAVVSAALLRTRRDAAAVVRATMAADLAGAAGLLAWLLVDSPAVTRLGTLVLAAVIASLVLQAAVDAVMLVTSRA